MIYYAMLWYIIWNNMKCYMGYYKKGFMKQKIYYTIDEETGAIVLDLYEMEQEALKQLKKEFPKKKVESVYVT